MVNGAHALSLVLLLLTTAFVASSSTGATGTAEFTTPPGYRIAASDEVAVAATDTCTSPDATAGLLVQPGDALYIDSAETPCCTCVSPTTGKSCKCNGGFPCSCTVDVNGECRCTCSGANTPIDGLIDRCRELIDNCPLAAESIFVTSLADDGVTRSME